MKRHLRNFLDRFKFWAEEQRIEIYNRFVSVVNPPLGYFTSKTRIGRHLAFMYGMLTLVYPPVLVILTIFRLVVFINFSYRFDFWYFLCGVIVLTYVFSYTRLADSYREYIPGFLIKHIGKDLFHGIQFVIVVGNNGRVAEEI